MRELVIVRHGRTEANAQGRLLGRHDPDLDDVGRAQAAALARVLAGPDRVISSPLARARQTAAGLGPAVEVDERWTELDYGEWDGLPTGEVAAEDWARWRAEPDFRPPGGESLLDLTGRVAGALDELSAGPDGTRIVVVTHVSPIKAAVAWALGCGPEIAWRTYVAPASVTRLGVGPTGPSLRGFNDTSHLP